MLLELRARRRRCSLCQSSISRHLWRMTGFASSQNNSIGSHMTPPLSITIYNLIQAFFCICTAVKFRMCLNLNLYVWFGQYADPVADLLDQWGVFRARLFRESCVFHRGNYVKDLSRLGRELSNVIIVDNSPASYIFHPENAVSS